MHACTMRRSASMRMRALEQIGLGVLLHGAIKVLPPSPSIRMYEHERVRAKAGVEVVDSETCEKEPTTRRTKRKGQVSPTRSITTGTLLGGVPSLRCEAREMHAGISSRVGPETLSEAQSCPAQASESQQSRPGPKRVEVQRHGVAPVPHVACDTCAFTRWSCLE